MSLSPASITDTADVPVQDMTTQPQPQPHPPPHPQPHPQPQLQQKPKQNSPATQQKPKQNSPPTQQKPKQNPPATQLLLLHQAKRKASQAGLDNHATGRSVKRRASKACVCCRSRKVRCNVTEHGAPCTNCRLDEVDCVVSESRRKKKWSKDDEHADGATAVTTTTTATTTTTPAPVNAASHPNRKLVARDALDKFLGAPASHDVEPSITCSDEHVPHSIYQTHGQRLNYSFSELERRMSTASSQPPHALSSMLGYSPLSTDSRQPYFAPIAPRVASKGTLPLNVKPLPARIGPDEIAYLDKKGALTIPATDLRNELLRAYVEFVHPYMPLLDLHEFLLILDRPDGTLGKLSLILYQAVMFAGSAFADMDHLRRAGYLNRKEARKDFFQKTRLLYDFDYESDRVSLVQALLLLTYYYETPDDQKDTWHWMGVATSVAHTIGLHRNPDKSNMDMKRTRLWKRIWWSTYMRDRLIALGMRRPTRIKSEDFDVPMMDLDDFDIAPLPNGVTCIPADCVIARDTEKQRQLAIMCIQKAKLCLCISHVLSKQYCVLNNNQGMHHDRTTMMLLPKKLDPQKCEVKACDDELQRWLDELPKEARYEDMPTDNPSINLHKALLHMVFYTTLSALHRPQVLPSAPAPNTAESGVELLDMSRNNVRRAASAITGIAQTLDSLDLVRYLPTTGVTVLLPAIIIHLLDIKAPEEETRRSSLRGFCQCMQVMGKLRDLYAAADYSTAFLEAAIRKAGIHIAPVAAPVVASAPPAVPASVSTTTANNNNSNSNNNNNKAGDMATSVEDLVNAGRRLDPSLNNNNHDASHPPHLLHHHHQGHPLPPPSFQMTPPPDLDTLDDRHNQQNVSDDEVARRLETFLASTPPPSDHQLDGSDASQADLHEQLDRETVVTSLSSLDEDMVAAATAAAGFGAGPGLSSGASALAAPQPSWTNVGLGGVECGVEGMGNAGMGVECDEGDFDSLLNLDAMGDVSAFAFNDFGGGEGGGGAQSEFGVGLDVDWMKTMDAIDAVV